MTVAEQITPRQRTIILLSSLAATSMVSIDLTITNVALPEIQGQLAIAPDQVGWVLTSYVVATAVATPLVGALVPRLGLRRYFLISIAIFSLASLACGLSSSLPQIVLFRFFQGLAGASFIPIGQMLIYDIVPRNQLSRALGVFTTGMLAGTVVGPSLGGFITEFSSWRWIFFINLPVGVATLSLLGAFLPRIPRGQSRPFDYFGFTLLAIMLVSFQLFLDRGQNRGWFESLEILAEFAVVLVAFYMLVVHTMTKRHPFIDPALITNRNFLVGCAINSSIGVVSFVPVVIQPLFLQHVQGYNTLDIGYILTPRGIALVALMLLLSRVSDRLDQRAMIFVGILTYVFGFYWLQFLAPQTLPGLLIYTGILQSLGSVLIMLQSNLIALSTLPAELRPMGASLFMLMRTVALGLGTALSISYVVSNTEDNHVRLSQNLSVYNPIVTKMIMPEGAPADPLSLKVLSLEVWRQATVIAYDNLFVLMLILSLLTLPLAFLVQRPKKAVTVP